MEIVTKVLQYELYKFFLALQLNIILLYSLFILSFNLVCDSMYGNHLSNIL